MSEFIPFKKEHLAPLLEQKINFSIREWALSTAVDMEKTDSVTLMYRGKVMVCGGIAPYWHGRGQLWSIFSEDSKFNFVPTMRGMKKWVHNQLKEKYSRIELSVEMGFLQGHRRAKLLGFELETMKAKKYLPSGETCSIYSLIRGD